MNIKTVLVVGLCLTTLVVLEAAQSTNIHQALGAQRVSVTLTETVANGWVPPTTWKLLYDGPVVEHEISFDIATPEWKLLKSTRLGMWIQNPLDRSDLFFPPGGEVDYLLGLTGPKVKGVQTSFEVRFIDAGSPAGKAVWTFGDNDLLRLRTRLTYPVVFDTGRHTIIPALIWYHVEPIEYRPKVSGDTICFQTSYEWKPKPWLKLGANAGFLHDEGVGGSISADVVSYGGMAGVRLMSKAPECWLNGYIQQYNTFGSPQNRPTKDFTIFSASLSVKF